MWRQATLMRTRKAGCSLHLLVHWLFSRKDIPGFGSFSGPCPILHFIRQCFWRMKYILQNDSMVHAIICGPNEGIVYLRARIMKKKFRELKCSVLMTLFKFLDQAESRTVTVNLLDFSGNTNSALQYASGRFPTTGTEDRCTGNGSSSQSTAGPCFRSEQPVLSDQLRAWSAMFVRLLRGNKLQF